MARAHLSPGDRDLSEDEELWVGMTNAEMRYLEGYLLKLARLLRIRNWAFRVMHHPLDTDDSAIAKVEPIPHRCIADIKLCWNFAQYPPEAKRQVLVHELLHCVIEPMIAIPRMSLCSQLGQPAYDVFWEVFRQQMEYAVDHLADVIAPHMPRYKFQPPRKEEQQ